MSASKHSQDGMELQCQMYCRKLLMMDREDAREFYNVIYLDDYCVWLVD